MTAVNLINSYNYALVALSVLIAMLASYAALSLAGRVTAAAGWTRAVWLLGGAVAMGTGIWSMHYIGMLAFILPVPVAYHWPTVLLSLCAAIVASAIALYVVSRQMMNAFRALVGSVLMGAGIASMHYIGMAAMRLPAMCQFSSSLVVLSVVFAVVISLAALWITFHFRDEKAGSGWRKTAGALVMGAAIPVMHYTGMAAASFTASDMPLDLSHAVTISTVGTLGIAAVTLILLGLTLVTSWLDRRFTVRTLELQEGKLKQSEAYLSEAQRVSHTGSFGWRPSTGEIHWSEETFRIFQHDRTTTPTVERVLQRVHPEDAALVKLTIERSAQDGQDFDFEHRLLMPDSSVKHVHVAAHAVSDDAGGIEFVGAVMDVTGQHQATAALEKALDEIQKSQNRLRLVIDTIPGMVWSGQPDGSFDYVNQPWLRYLGCSWEELSARGGLVSVVHPDDVEESVARWNATRAAGRHTDHELRMRRADGEYRWFLARALPLRDEGGNVVRWYGTATDIEDRKRAETLLAGERRLFEMMARGESRSLILDALCRLVEELAGGSLASILLLDPKAKRLWHGAAPSLPTNYTKAIDGIVIDPSVGSWWTAAYHAEPAIASDIATDPLWADYRSLALAHGLQACWSTPILSSARRVLGTFAIYYREPRSPTPQERNLIEQITHLASIAVEREQAEEAQLRLGAIVASSDDAIISKTLGGVITSWNAGAQRIFGYTVEEAVGHPIHILIPPDRQDEEALIIDRLRRGESVEHFETVRTTKDARQIHVSLAISPIKNPAGQIIGASKIARDITARKRAEEALRRQANLLEQTHDAIIVWEFSRTIVFWNRGAEQLYGFSKEEAIGHACHELLQAEHPLPRLLLEAALERNGEWTGELTHTARDGRKILVESRHVLVREADGRRLVLETNRDISERKRAEEALRQAQADLAHVGRVTTLGEMAASIAHEVDQPLSGVVINANACLRFLAGPPNLDEVRDGLQAIVRDGRRASDVIARIRALARRTPDGKVPLDINEVVREVVVLAEGEARRTRARVRTELAGDLPRVVGDPVQLQQVVLNLFLNGLDAMSAVVDRPRELIMSTHQEAADRVHVAVQDSGSGIDPQHAHRMFEAFYTTKPSGMGMGLSISRSIVEQHGGRLWAVPNDGPGTTFHFTV
jgi:PAS domain S-box-containing protein